MRFVRAGAISRATNNLWLKNFSYFCHGKEVTPGYDCLFMVY